jgi:outer membrane protein OmpU
LNGVEAGIPFSALSVSSLSLLKLSLTPKSPLVLNHHHPKRKNMRKILLATTALIGVTFAGAAHAAAPASPISLNVGGYDDFIAGVDNGGYIKPNSPTNTTGPNKTVGHDFEDEFKLSFDALGKASNGVEYGANISLWNGPEVGNNWVGGNNAVEMNSAYVWMSGAFGKVLFGDEHGASDLFVYAPTVGEGQIDGRFRDFVSNAKVASFAIMPSGFDNTEHSTKVTYYTPKVGNDSNKVQLGLSYAPQLYNYGANIVGTAGGNVTNGVSSNLNSPYQDIEKAVVQYTGNFKPVNVTGSAQWIHGGRGNGMLSATTLGANGNGATPAGNARSFNAWGVGTQVAFNGFTFGGAYNNLGDYNTVKSAPTISQNRGQDSWNVGGKYEFDKVGVALSYIHGKGYDNMLQNTQANAGTATNVQTDTNYVKHYNAIGTGATYTWFPGLTSNIDGVLFNEEVADPITVNNGGQLGNGNGTVGGYTVLLSQRLAF